MPVFRVEVNVINEITKQEEVYVETGGKLTAKDVETALEKDFGCKLDNAVSGDFDEDKNEWEWVDGPTTVIHSVTEIDPADKSISNCLPTLAIDEDGKISCLP